jgi:PAS domain S-box-containing protein
MSQSHHARLTHSQFSRSLWRAVLPPLLLLAGHAAIVAVLLLWMLSTSDWARVSDQAITATHDLERLLLNMETGYRGYKLTGREDFLRPQLQAKAQIDKAILELQGQVNDDPRQVDRLREIAESYRAWDSLQDELGPPVRSLADGEMDALIRRKARMDRMRQLLQEMVLTETDRRATRYDRAANASTLAILGSAGVSVLAGIGLALINRRTILELSRAYREALDAEAARAGELEASRRHFRDLSETVPQLLFVVGEDGQVSYVNQRWTSYTGTTSDQLGGPGGAGWVSAIHPDDRPGAIVRWRDAERERRPFEGEFRLHRSLDGAYRWFLCRATPVVDRTGTKVTWFATCTDIEAQKQVEREREALLAAERAARSDLLRTSQVKDEFLATLSHELRTPMTAILGWSRLLRDPSVRDKTLDRAIEAIDANARAQARLIEDLLDMSRIVSGKLAIKPEPVDLAQIARAAMDSIGPAAAAKRITVLPNIADDEDLNIQGDPARLQQVAWNLLSNAVKFTPNGGRVRVEVRRVGEFAELAVIDSGPGIKPSFLPHVFERFRQADGSTTRQHGGLGLGLAIAKHLVEMHGGEIAADSEGEGRGATFTVRLPLRPAHLLTQAGANLPPAWQAASVRLDGIRVLAVEDDKDTALIVKTILENAGAVVASVLTATEALDLLRRQSFDLLLSDIGMPEMDGYGLIRRAREMESGLARPPTPAVALSAFARAEDRRAAIAAGYQMHVSKPVAPEELVAAVANVLKPPLPRTPGPSGAS